MPAVPPRPACARVSSSCAPPIAPRASSSLDGEQLTCERVKQAVERAFGDHGAAADEFIVSHGSQTAIGHDMGSGPIAANDIVLFDLFPRDRETGCFADFTRTFSIGPAPAEIAEFHRLSKEALDLAIAAVAPGVSGRAIHVAVCDFFHEHGYPTQLHKGEAKVLRDGFYHATGHGVGLEVHEQPSVGRIDSRARRGRRRRARAGALPARLRGRPARGSRARDGGRRARC